MDKKRIIITGATGAIGMALIDKCLKEGNEVIVISRPDSNRLDRIQNRAGVQVVFAALEHLLDAAEQIEQPCDIFYHFAWAGTTGAARNDMYLQNLNIRYTLDAVLLAEKLGCHTFIGAGSQAEYGRVEGVLAPATPAFPENGYGMAKLCAGQMSRQMCEERNIRHIWTRILSVYGPYDGAGSLVSSVIQKLLAKEHISLTKGEQMWDYLYSRDAAEAMYALAEGGIGGKTYCIGKGAAQPLKEYILTIARKTLEKTLNNAGFDAKTENSDNLLGFGDIAYANRQVMHLCADISDLTADTGFVPTTSFEEGICETIEWWMKER